MNPALDRIGRRMMKTGGDSPSGKEPWSGLLERAKEIPVVGNIVRGFAAANPPAKNDVSLSPEAESAPGGGAAGGPAGGAPAAKKDPHLPTELGGGAGAPAADQPNWFERNFASGKPGDPWYKRYQAPLMIGGGGLAAFLLYQLLGRGKDRRR